MAENGVDWRCLQEANNSRLAAPGVAVFRTGLREQLLTLRPRTGDQRAPAREGAGADTRRWLLVAIRRLRCLAGAFITSAATGAESIPLRLPGHRLHLRLLGRALAVLIEVPTYAPAARTHRPSQVRPSHAAGKARRAQNNTESGGERQMLAMARILRTGAHVLLLDEITEGLAPP